MPIGPIPHALYSDNLGATCLITNLVFRSRRKHIAINYHFVRDLVQPSELRVVHVSAADQLADALSKSLSRPRLLDICTKIGVSRTTSRGGIYIRLLLRFIFI